MSKHQNPDHLKDLLNKGLIGDKGVGATGQYPQGKYDEHDEGEIQFAIAADVKNQKILIDFGKSVHSIGMTPTQALELALMLTRKASECRQGR